MFLRCIKTYATNIYRRKTILTSLLLLLSLLALSVHYGFNLTSKQQQNEISFFNRDARHRSDLLKNSVSLAMKRYDTEMEMDKKSEEWRQNEMKNIIPLVEMGLPYVYFNSENLYIPSERVVHLDLKGGPPTVSYLKRILPLLKTLGATAILIEYEDMFPFTGMLKDIRALNAYSKKAIQEIINTAQNLDLKVIPLVQTFGHLEFALKRPKFADMREDPNSPTALCPRQNKSLNFLELMLSQVMQLHQNYITHIHIGCDEVYHLGECSLCSEAVKVDATTGRDKLFLEHVSKVVNIIRKRWPNLKIIIWDDMLRRMSNEVLSAFKKHSDYVQPMVWVYIEDIYRFAPSDIFSKYSMFFKHIWAASAFKGAFGETLTVPDARRHLENNLQWLKVMAAQTKRFTRDFFQGIALTGWSRYDHFAVLCELLPASIPSLVLSLIAVTSGRFDTSHLKLMSGALGCPTHRSYDVVDATAPPIQLDFNNDPSMWRALSSCLFPGSQFFALTGSIFSSQTEAEEFIQFAGRQKGWLTVYNRGHNFSSPDRIRELTGGTDGDSVRILKSLIEVTRRTHDALKGVLLPETAKEWIETHPYDTIIRLEKLLEDAKSMALVKHWKRRPLQPPAGLSRFDDKELR